MPVPLAAFGGVTMRNRVLSIEHVHYRILIVLS